MKKPNVEICVEAARLLIEAANALTESDYKIMLSKGASNRTANLRRCAIDLRFAIRKMMDQ